MAESSDYCSLDGRLIELVAAASEAQAEGSAKAESIMQRAANYKMKLIGNLKKTRTFKMGTDIEQSMPDSRGLRHYKNLRWVYGPGSV